MTPHTPRLDGQRWKTTRRIARNRDDADQYHVLIAELQICRTEVKNMCVINITLRDKSTRINTRISKSPREVVEVDPRRDVGARPWTAALRNGAWARNPGFSRRTPPEAGGGTNHNLPGVRRHPGYAVGRHQLLRPPGSASGRRFGPEWCGGERPPRRGGSRDASRDSPRPCAPAAPGSPRRPDRVRRFPGSMTGFRSISGVDAP